MCLSNQELLLIWVDQVEKLSQTVKYGYYENDVFMDAGTIFPSTVYHFQPDKILEVTTEHFICLRSVGIDHFIGVPSLDLVGASTFRQEIKEVFYASNLNTDTFGQVVTFRNPPTCFLIYMDTQETDAVDFLLSLDDETTDWLYEDLDAFMDWSNNKYPHSITCSGESLDPDTCKWFWDCYTYNPKYSKEEISAMINEYITECKDTERKYHV